MPQYDFRCEACHHRFSLRFKTYALADAAKRNCPACHSHDVTRLISQVAIPRPNRDYGKLSSKEMLSVLESGDSGQVDEMFQQVSGRQSAEGGAGVAPKTDEPPD